MAFDLLTQPWVPTVGPSGQLRELGLMEVLRSAHQLREVFDPSPPIAFGLCRLLIALVTDAFALRELEDVEALLQAGRFDPQALERYAQRCGDCFDLFHPDKPFLQSAADTGNGDKEFKGVSSLAQHLPTGTFATHFHHGLSSDHSFGPAACARLLTSIAPFMTAGGAGLSPSINGIPPWYVLVIGRNLFETLVLNCCVLEGPWSQRPGTPAWRDGTGFAPKKEVRRFDLLQGLTWRPRSVRLIPTDGGICTYSGSHSDILVREVVFTFGLRAVNEGGAWIDPQAAYRTTEKGIFPLRPQEGQVLWRETGPLLLLRNAQYAGDGGKIRFERPIVVSQFRKLQELGAIEAARPIQVQCFGLRTDGKMKVFEWQSERLALPSTVLAMPGAGGQVQQAMDAASWTANVLRKAIKVAYPRDGDGNPKAFEGLITEARHHFWTGLRPRFGGDGGSLGDDTFLVRLSRQDPDDADAPQRLYRDWLDVLRAHGFGSLDRVLGDLDTDADALRRQVRSRDLYWREWSKLTSPTKGKAKAASPAQEDDL